MFPALEETPTLIQGASVDESDTDGPSGPSNGTWKIKDNLAEPRFSTILCERLATGLSFEVRGKIGQWLDMHGEQVTPDESLGRGHVEDVAGLLLGLKALGSHMEVVPVYIVKRELGMETTPSPCISRPFPALPRIPALTHQSSERKIPRAVMGGF